MQGQPRAAEIQQMTDASLATGAPDVPQLVGGRYRVLAPRGSGAEASVYLAVDLFTDKEVALKLGPPARLAAEYQRSATLLHPHLARALSLWRAPGTASLAFEYGAQDLTALRGRAEALVVRHVAEIARALGYLHRLGIVHGDVKPQNAVLAGPPAGRRALLVDLGLAGVQPAARGSLEYAAPEVLEGAPPDAASDLYSLGVMLHELLSGANPFAARTPADVIRAHFESVPPARASAGVRAVVSKLVAREVRSRYAQTDEVIEALSAATGLALDSEGDGLAPDRVGLGQLHGREAELARIDAAARRVAAGTGARIVLVGPPGSGRSRLLHAAGAAAELAGLRVLSVQSGEGLASLYRWLGILLGAGVPGEPSVGAARERLAAACAQHPLALLVDDADSRQDWLRSLVLGLARDPGWQDRPLLVIAAATQQLDASLERIELRPLSPALAKTKLVEALGARSWADGLADQLVRETSGHPGELEGALHDLAGRRLLTRRGGRWELDLLFSGPGLAGCIPRASTWAARAAVLAVPEHQRSALGQAAVLWEELDANMLAGEQAHLVAEGLRVAEEAGRRFSQRAVLRAAQPAAARREYARALARGGSPGRIWQKVAKARWQEGRFEQVLEALARARSAGADPLAVTTVEARAEAMRGEYSRAEELATAA